MSAAAAQDHYALLGVAYDASDAVIASAYRTQALRLHPDKAAGAGVGLSASERAQANAQFLHLQQAYSVLKDKEARQQYDAALQAGGLRLSSSTAAALSFNEVDLDECGYDDAECLYSYSCRCGAELLIDEASLQRGIDLFPCSQCSIVYRVLYEWEPDEEEQEADAKAAMEGNADPAVTTT